MTISLPRLVKVLPDTSQGRIEYLEVLGTKKSCTNPGWVPCPVPISKHCGTLRRQGSSVSLTRCLSHKADTLLQRNEKDSSFLSCSTVVQVSPANCWLSVALSDGDCNVLLRLSVWCMLQGRGQRENQTFPSVLSHHLCVHDFWHQQ